MTCESDDSDRLHVGSSAKIFNHAQRIKRRPVEIDDDESRGGLAHGREHPIPRANEMNRAVSGSCCGAKLRAEQQVIDDRDNARAPGVGALHHGKMIADMLIRTAAAPPFYKNGYVVSCESTRQGVLIDPGDEVEELLATARRDGTTVTSILLTHAHLDHVTGVARAKRALDVDVWLHKDDEFLYNGVVEQGMMFGIRVEPQPKIDHYFNPGTPLTFGNCTVDIFHTPGHCPGGVCLAIGEAGSSARHLFVGDTLFAGSIGRTDLPGGDTETLLRSIREVLFRFPDESIVYSGHGPVTTIGDERRTNPFLS